MARKQSSKIWYQGNLHKEIYFQGHYHDAMYKGSDLIWQKLNDVGPVVAGNPVAFFYHDGITYAYLDAPNYKGDGKEYMVFCEFDPVQEEFTFLKEYNRQYGTNIDYQEIQVLDGQYIIDQAGVDDIYVGVGNTMRKLTSGILTKPFESKARGIIYDTNSYIRAYYNRYAVRDYSGNIISEVQMLPENYSSQFVFMHGDNVSLFGGYRNAETGHITYAIARKGSASVYVAQFDNPANQQYDLMGGKSRIYKDGVTYFVGGRYDLQDDDRYYLSKHIIFAYDGLNVNVVKTIDYQYMAERGNEASGNIARTENYVFMSCAISPYETNLFIGRSPYNLQKISVDFSQKFLVKNPILLGAMEGSNYLFVYMKYGMYHAEIHEYKIDKSTYEVIS